MRHHLRYLPLLCLSLVSAHAQSGVALTSSNQLVSFNVTTPGAATASVAISGLAGGETVVGIDYRPATRTLVGVTNQNRLLAITPATGATSVLATLSVPLAGTSFGVDFNPAADRLRIISNTGQSLRVNVENGATTVDGSLAYATTDANAGTTPQVAAAGYTNSVAGRLATSTVLYDIDYGRDVLVRQDPPNNGTLVTLGTLGVDFSANSDIDIVSPGAAYAVNNAGGVATLYSLNLTTGAATSLGTFAAGSDIVDIALEVKEPAAGIINTSARGMVSAGEGAVITGFVVGGTAPMNVLVVARGPSLTAFGVTVALADTRVALFRGATQLEANDDWQTHPRNAEITATSFAPGSPRESAVLMTLQPGAYTAVVTAGGTATTGIAIVEVYELP
ncbi:MAG: DUF4394 domain-containing protein [Verrucomicrobiota bacterium]